MLWKTWVLVLATNRYRKSNLETYIRRRAIRHMERTCSNFAQVPVTRTLTDTAALRAAKSKLMQSYG